MVALFSSNTNEGIRAVLFLLRKDFTRTKKCKNAHKGTKTKRAVLNALKKHLRGTKTKRAVLNVLKKHLRGKSCLFTYLRFYAFHALFVLFVLFKSV